MNTLDSTARSFKCRKHVEKVQDTIEESRRCICENSSSKAIRVCQCILIIPTLTQATQAEASVDTDDSEAEIDQGISSDVSGLKSRNRSHGIALPVVHSLLSCSSSPVSHSSKSLQKKAKSHKRSYSMHHSESPVARSLSSRSSSPPAVSDSHSDTEHQNHSSLPVTPGPLRKKAKTGPQFAMSAQSTKPVYREGAEINHKKPKASDYEDIVQALILRAASQYEAAVSTQDSFPDTTLRLKWARKAWNDANNDAGHEYEITDEISSLVNLSNLFDLRTNSIIFLASQTWFKNSRTCLDSYSTSCVKYIWFQTWIRCSSYIFQSISLCEFKGWISFSL